MKTSSPPPGFTRVAAIFGLALLIASTHATRAQSTLWFKGATNGSLGTAGNWATDASGTTAGSAPSTLDNIVLNATAENGQDQSVNMAAANRAYNSMVVSNSASTTISRASTTNTGSVNFTLMSGLTNATGAGSLKFGDTGQNVNFRLGDTSADFTLANNSANAVTFLSSVALASSVANNRTLQVAGSGSGSVIFSSGLANSSGGSVLSLRISNAGAVQLGTSSFSGGTILDQGTIALSAGSALGTGSLTINGGAIGSVTSSRTITNNILVNGDFGLGVTNAGFSGQSTTLNGNIDLQGGSRTITMLANSTTVGGVISNGGLTLDATNSSRSLTLTNAATYTGLTEIKGGSLVLSGAGLLDSGTALNISAATTSATLNITGITANELTVGSLAGGANGTLALGAKNFTAGGDNANTTFAGTITGSGSVTKTGTGTMTLSTANSHSGGTVLSAGAIALNSGGALGSGTLTINGGQIGSITSQRTLANAVVVGGNFTLGGMSGGASTTLNGDMDLGGAARTITLGNSATLGGVVSNGGLIIESSNATRFLNLTNNNSYTGPTTVNGGIFRVNGSLASSSVTINSGATLGGSGTISGATFISGTHSPGNSPGLQTFDSDLTYNSGASVIWELEANTLGGRGTSYDGIDVGGDLDFSGPVVFNLVFNGPGSAVTWSDDLWKSDYLGASGWLVYSVADGGTINNFTNLTLSVIDWVDSGANSLSLVRGGAIFSLFEDGNNIYLNYTAVPEPSSYALLGLAVAAMAGYRIRRLKRMGR